MGRFRFSIAGLMGVVVFAGAGVAALREATSLWDSALFTAALATLLVAATLALYRDGRGRAFWLGFALFGSTYLILSLLPTVEPRLLTSRGLHALDAKVREHAVPVNWAFASPGPGPGLTFSSGNGPGPVQVWDVTTGLAFTGTDGSIENFVRIGHSLVAMILAFLGGWLAVGLLARRRRADTHDSPAAAKPPAPEG
jgi:hypothetical protein